MSMRFCTKCGCKVDKDTEMDYSWYCPNCDENLYFIETDTERELEYKEILYGLYLHNWVTTHNEGEPVCFSEFLDNEYHETELMTELIEKYHAKIRKMCPYCGKDVGDEIWDTDYSIYDCGKCEENEYSYMDYIVECPNCNGGFHWIEICKRINTVIQNSDTGELTQYKE